MNKQDMDDDAFNLKLVRFVLMIFAVGFLLGATVGAGVVVYLMKK